MSSIKSLSQSKDREAFILEFAAIQSEIYSSQDHPCPDPKYWIHLIKVMKDREKELFIYRDDNYCGRILVNLTDASDDAIFFGMFEFSESAPHVGKELLDAAKRWGSSRDKSLLHGPIDFNVWFSNRLKTNYFDHQLSWEPNNPERYVKCLTDYGMKVSKNYISCFYDSLETTFDRTKPSYDGLLEKGFSFRKVDLRKDSEADHLFDLNVASFKHNYLYEDISREVYQKTYIDPLKKTDNPFSFFILNSNKVECGYIYAFEDEVSNFVIKSMLVHPDFQGAKLSSALVHKCIAEAKNAGLTSPVGAMVRKGNISEQFFRYLGDAKRVHEYALFSKKINK